MSELSVNQKQVLITGFLGDGHIAIQRSGRCYYSATSTDRVLLETKSYLLGDLSMGIKEKHQAGYGKKKLYYLSSRTSDLITQFKKAGLQNALDEMTDLGFSLWVYDDGSMHKKNLFYNLCTHKYSKEVHENTIIPFLHSRGINAKILEENKKDGRKFFYCYIGKHDGAYKVNKILREHPIYTMEYKMWDRNYQKAWEQVEEDLLKGGRQVNRTHKSMLINKILKPK